MRSSKKDNTPSGVQIDLFEHVAGAYGQTESGRLTNSELYRMAVGRAGIDRAVLDKKEPIGKSGIPRSPLTRRLRWMQQSLRSMGLIEKVSGQRGVWELTQGGREKLRTIKDGVCALAFSTDLGIAIWSNCNTVFQNFEGPVCAVISSPPYPLSVPRAYGNPKGTQAYLDFIIQSLEPIVKNLVCGGNVALVVGDVFNPHEPSKSTHIEELTLLLERQLGLRLMNRIPWVSNKPPGPIAWASKRRVQLNEGYETILWMCNSPKDCISDNRRVLVAHSETHQRLINRGGEQRTATYGDGAYRIRPGSYGKPTSGAIMRNVIYQANTCASQRAYKARARELGLAVHGAPMPLELARTLVRFLTDVGQLVVEPFGGSLTVPLACEQEGRPWISTETVFDYVRGGAERFRDSEGFELALAADLEASDA